MRIKLRIMSYLHAIARSIYSCQIAQSGSVRLGFAVQVEQCGQKLGSGSPAEADLHVFSGSFSLACFRQADCNKL